MNLKQRVFLDIIKQVPYGSKKMTARCNVVDEYIEELKKNPEAVALATTLAVDKANKNNPFLESIPELTVTAENVDPWFVSCEIISRAYEEVRQAYDWLIIEGYVRKWTKKVRFGNMTYHGLTDKGWAVAKLYIELEKKQAAK